MAKQSSIDSFHQGSFRRSPRGSLILARIGASSSVREKYLVTVSGGTLRIWNRDATMVDEVHARSSLVRAAGFDDGGDVLVAGTAEGYVQVWDVSTGMTVFLARRTGEAINEVQFMPGPAPPGRAR
ncbi:MAG: hypothetical protein AB7V44_14310 [Pseudonocardia sp.]